MVSVDILEYIGSLALGAGASIIALFALTVSEKRKRRELRERQELLRAALSATSQPAHPAHGDERVEPLRPARDRLDPSLDYLELSAERSAESRDNAPVANALNDYLLAHHRQALSQARIQFWISAMAATFGFIWMLGLGSIVTPEASLFGQLAPGVFVELIAGLFFSQTKETRERATALYESLRRDSSARAAIELVDRIQDQRIKSGVQAQIALQLAGLNPSVTELNRLLGGQPDADKP